MTWKVIYQVNRMIVHAGVLGCTTAVESAEKTSMYSEYSGDRDENILDLQDQVPDR